MCGGGVTVSSRLFRPANAVSPQVNLNASDSARLSFVHRNSFPTDVMLDLR